MNLDRHFENVKNHFDQADENHLRGVNSEHGYLLNALYIIEQMNAKKNSKVLEIGVGDGIIMKKIAELRPDIKFFGLDISENLIKHAKNNNPNAELISANAVDEIPFDIKFDRIFSFSVIQYFPPESLLHLDMMILKSLDKDGKILHCSIPDNKKKLVTILDDMTDRFSPLLANLHAIKFYLLESGERYGSDGSFWHDAEKIKTDIETNYNDCLFEIKRPSDSWYRFDYSLKLN